MAEFTVESVEPEVARRMEKADLEQSGHRIEGEVSRVLGEKASLAMLKSPWMIGEIPCHVKNILGYVQRLEIGMRFDFVVGKSRHMSEGYEALNIKPVVPELLKDLYGSGHHARGVVVEIFKGGQSCLIQFEDDGRVTVQGHVRNINTGTRLESRKGQSFQIGMMLEFQVGWSSPQYEATNIEVVRSEGWGPTASPVIGRVSAQFGRPLHGNDRGAHRQSPPTSLAPISCHTVEEALAENLQDNALAEGSTTWATSSTLASKSTYAASPTGTNAVARVVNQEDRFQPPDGNGVGVVNSRTGLGSSPANLIRDSSSCSTVQSAVCERRELRRPAHQPPPAPMPTQTLPLLGSDGSCKNSHYDGEPGTNRSQATTTVPDTSPVYGNPPGLLQAVSAFTPYANCLASSASAYSLPPPAYATSAPPNFGGHHSSTMSPMSDSRGSCEDAFLYHGGQYQYMSEPLPSDDNTKQLEAGGSTLGVASEAYPREGGIFLNAHAVSKIRHADVESRDRAHAQDVEHLMRHLESLQNSYKTETCEVISNRKKKELLTRFSVILFGN